MIKVTTVPVKSYLSKSKIPGADYAINPYIGCPHKCLYCYAKYMIKFSAHTEAWGDFLDVKIAQTPLRPAQLFHAHVLLSSVTDPYNPFEQKYGLTRKILAQLADAQAYVSVLTKSPLIVRDIDLLQQLPQCEAGLSFSGADETLRARIEPGAASICAKIEALKTLHAHGIRTAVMIAPLLPQLTDWEKIITLTRPYTDTYRIDRLNMRTTILRPVMDFIEMYYPHLLPLYRDLFLRQQTEYWDHLSHTIRAYVQQERLAAEVFF
jgi:DNA repair photolyase